MAEKLKGWILLHRQIQDCIIWLDEEPFDRRSAWIDLLLLVNHSETKILFNGSPLTIERGQYLTSIRKLAERWHWSYNRTVRYLNLLEELQMIRRDSDSHRSLISIENYGIYQDLKITNRSTDECTDERAHERQTKNSKNSKNVNKNIYGAYSHVKLTDEEFAKLGSEYGGEIRDKAITFLDEYCEDKKSYKHNSDYLCIRRWVIDAVTEKKKPAKPNSFGQGMRQHYDMEALEKAITGG